MGYLNLPLRPKNPEVNNNLGKDKRIKKDECILTNVPIRVTDMANDANDTMVPSDTNDAESQVMKPKKEKKLVSIPEKRLSNATDATEETNINPKKRSKVDLLSLFKDCED